MVVVEELEHALARGAHTVSYTHLDVYKRQTEYTGRVDVWLNRLI